MKEFIRKQKEKRKKKTGTRTKSDVGLVGATMINSSRESKERLSLTFQSLLHAVLTFN